MKKFLLAIMLTAMALSAGAQDKRRHFDPDKFRAEMEQFITVEAGLTPSEAARLFPLYNEMKQEMRALFNKSRKLRQLKPADDRRCKEAIAEMDQLEIEMKQVQMNYHTRFLTVISASKLYDVIMAEEKFHRSAMRKASKEKK